MFRVGGSCPGDCLRGAIGQHVQLCITSSDAGRDGHKKKNRFVNVQKYNFSIFAFRVPGNLSRELC